jgi:AcrR family transcriptional regulator
MGRIAGVTAEETKQRLLATAADVFARLGYERASIAQIASDAGLSTGAIYAHYAGKAELFVATLRAHAEQEVEQLLGGESNLDFASFLVARGESLERRSTADSNLLIEAVVAAKRDPQVLQVLVTSFVDRERMLVDLLRAAQEVGAIDGDLAPDAVVRFTFMLALGSVLVRALDLPSIDRDDWGALIRRLVDNIRAVPRGAER